MGESRTSIFLFGSTTRVNPMTKPHHQLDTEMMAIGLGQKEAQKATETLKAFIVSPDKIRPVAGGQDIEQVLGASIFEATSGAQRNYTSRPHEQGR